MNLLLVEPTELQADGTAVLRGRRVQHAREVLSCVEGDLLRVGVRGGLVGTGTVVSLTPEALTLTLVLDRDPPPRAKVDLVLAIPRPKALKKVLPAVASLGVERVFLVNAARVEKSYFDSKVLSDAFLADLLSQGLEQARDTRAPEVLLRPRLKPFIEDEAPLSFGDALKLLAHPTAAGSLIDVASSAPGRTVLAVGPEGGWVPFELELLERAGFIPFTLGPRILRVEVAVPFLLGSLAALRPTIA